MSNHDDSTTSNATSSDSSSSEEEVVVKQKKKAVKNFNGLCYIAANRNSNGYCLMAKDSKNEKNDDSSDSENESEVRTYDELILEVESLTYALDNRNKLIKDTKVRHTQFTIDLENAAKEIELLKSAVSKLDELKVAQSEVAKNVSAECSECTTHMLDLVALQSKCAALVEERDVVLASLDELKASRVLLSACDACPTLQSKLDEARAKIRELEKSSIPECMLCLARVDELNELRAIQALTEEENEYLRTVSWMSSREPQLGMLFSEFKRHDGFGVGKIIEHLNHHWVYGLVGECAEKRDTQASTSKPIPTKDGVYTEPPPKTPKETCLGRETKSPKEQA